MHLIVRVLIFTLVLAVGAYLLPGVHIDGFTSALILGILLIALNTFLKPILKTITLPINVLTLGLFSFVINALIILLADYLLSGFEVDSFWWAVLFSIVLSVISAIIPGEQM